MRNKWRRMLGGPAIRTKVYILLVLAVVLVVTVTLPKLSVEQKEPDEHVDFFEMSLEELMEIEVDAIAKEKSPDVSMWICLTDSKA